MKIRMIPIEHSDEIDDIEVLNDHISIVHMVNGQKAFLNEQGKIVDGRFWDWIGNSAEGRHCVRSEGLYGFVDDWGKPVIQPVWEAAQAFSGGMSIVTRNGKMGAIDSNGALAIPAQWDFIYSFNFEAETTEAICDQKIYHIDKRGNQLSNEAWEDASFFFENCAPVKKDGVWNFIGADGRVICRSGWEAEKHFTDGLAPVKKNGKWGCINASGDLVIPCEWDQLEVFGDGLVSVCKNDLWGFVDHSGEIVLEIEWENGADWCCVQGYDIPVILRKGDTCCYYDTKARRLIHGEWYPLENFQEGRAMVLCNETRLIGYINLEGEYISLPQWDEAAQFEDGIACVCRDGKYGAINLEGEIVHDVIWDSLDDAGCGRFVVRKDGAHYILHANGSRFKTDPCHAIFSFFSGAALALTLEDGDFHYHYMGLDGKIIDRCINQAGETVPMPDWNQLGMFSGGKSVAWLGEQAYLLILDGEAADA